MSEPIQPALTAEQWATMYVRLPNHEFAAHEPDGSPYTTTAYLMHAEADVADSSMLISDAVWQGGPALAALIALANAALPDGDPRKITREWVRELGWIADSARLEWGDDCDEAALLTCIADALASYLPPEAE